MDRADTGRLQTHRAGRRASECAAWRTDPEDLSFTFRSSNAQPQAELGRVNDALTELFRSDIFCCDHIQIPSRTVLTFRLGVDSQTDNRKSESSKEM